MKVICSGADKPNLCEPEYPSVYCGYIWGFDVNGLFLKLLGVRDVDITSWGKKLEVIRVCQKDRSVYLVLSGLQDRSPVFTVLELDEDVLPILEYLGQQAQSIFERGGEAALSEFQ